MDNTNKLLDAFFNRCKNETQEDNVYTPPEGLNGLKIAHTTMPDKPYGFNEVFENTIKSK